MAAQTTKLTGLQKFIKVFFLASVGLLVAVIILVQCATRSASPPPTTAAAIQQKLPDVSVGQANGVLTINYAPASVFNESTYLYSVGQMMIDALKIVVERKGEQFSQVDFVTSAPSQDAYGNSHSTLTFTISMPMSEAVKVNYANISTDQILNLAEVTSTPFGRKVAIEYCSDADHLKALRNFCVSAIR